VVIGGIAAEIHDLPVPATVDIDVTPARDAKNLERLARAFDELEAGLYTAEETGTWFPRTPVELWSQYDTLHLMTKVGPIDIVFVPDGAPSGYAELAAGAVDAVLDDQPVLVISVRQVVRTRSHDACGELDQQPLVGGGGLRCRKS
jgi:hypothetical protein